MSEVEALKARIARDGPVPLAAYMRACATDYYEKGVAIGKCGDFTTAPEICQVFGELIGLWCVVMWEKMGRPDPFRLVEAGPGHGTLMADLWRAAGVAPAFREAARIHLIEPSPALREIQDKTLKGITARWHAEPDDLPPEAPVIFVMNEMLDVLPVHSFIHMNGKWQERYINFNAKGNFVFETGPPSVAPPEIAGKDGDLAETSPERLAAFAGFAERIKAQGGAGLVFDYGPARTTPGDTLQCLHKHRPVSLFDAPGESDITAHVDFSALASLARAKGLTTAGPAEQGTWLVRMGLPARLDTLRQKADENTAAAITEAARRLTCPHRMGTLFKVLGVSSPGLSDLPGFTEAP